MKKEMCFVFVYDVVEHERGWGIRPDGYMCFPDAETGNKWVREKYENRNINSVPDCYDTYENGRWEPVHETLHDKVIAEGHIWIRSLKEIIKPTKTRKIELVWTLELDPDDFKLTDDELYNKYFGDIVVIGVITIK
jgi:hypothetical protein